MTCEQLAALYEEYALGVLEGEERAEMDAHLARPGDQCIHGVAEARWMVAQLSHAAPAAEPPAALRGKIMNAVKQTAAKETPVVSPIEKAKPEPKIGPQRAAFPMWAWAAAAALSLIHI